MLLVNLQLAQSEKDKAFVLAAYENATQWNYNSFTNSTLKKKFISLADRGSSILSDDKFTEVCYTPTIVVIR